MGTAFGTVLRDPVTATNVVLAGANAGASTAQLACRGARAARGAAARRRGGRGPLGPGVGGGGVYTDDDAPVEWLIDESIVAVAAKGSR